MKLNKKGYMLVEIILASALAFGLAYFLLELTLKVKSKDDDLFVETLVATDKTIIMNKLMTYAKSEEFDCNKLKINDHTIEYNDEVIVVVNKYTKIGNKTCSTENNQVSINIPLSVPQMPDKNYDISFEYKYIINPTTPLSCDITVEGTKLKATYTGSEIVKYGFDDVESSLTSKEITGTGTYTFYIKNASNNQTYCSVIISNIKSDNTCDTGYTKMNENYCYQKQRSK